MTFMKKIFLRATFVVLILFQSALSPKVIVWDLGYVCLAPGKFTMAWSIGLPSLIYHKVTGGGDVKKKMFDFLTDTFGKQQPINPKDPQNQWTYVMGDGFILPEIWCEHMKGKYTGAEILEKSYPYLETYFTSTSERNLIKSLMQHVFDPKKFSEHMHPIEETIQLMNDLMQQGDTTCMILSNFAMDAFTEMHNKPESQALFKHINKDHLIVSGDVGMLKPHQDIYEYLKEKLIAHDSRFADQSFLARECIFIDDQIENIIAARKQGITSYHFDGNHQKLRIALVLGRFLTQNPQPLGSKP